MKTTISCKAILKKTLSILLALLIVLNFADPLTAEARTKKITLKPVVDITKDYISVKNATKVKKGIKYKVYLKRKKDHTYHDGYVKFTAPASKTYTITVNNLKHASSKTVCFSVTPEFYVETSRYYLNYLYDPSIGGERDFDGPAWISNRKLNSFWKKKATTKMTLTKGETVYIGMSAYTSTRNYKKVSVDFSIK